MEMPLNIPANISLENINIRESFSLEGQNSKDFLSLLTNILEVLNDEKDLSDININLRDSKIYNDEKDLTLELKGLLNSMRFLDEKSSKTSNIDEELNNLLKFSDETENPIVVDSNEIDELITMLNSENKNDSDMEVLSENDKNFIDLIGKVDISIMQKLDDLSQNTKISSKLQNIILNLESRVDNKEITNIFKTLQKFTNGDGSLNINSILNQIKSSSGNEQGTFTNMNMSQQSTLGNVLNSIVKEVNVFKTSDIVDVVVENFKTLRLPGRCEMTIKLNPKELGEITLRLVLEKGDVSASISTNKKEIFILLQNNISTFLDQLKTSETGINHISINLNQEQDQSGEGARRGYKDSKEEKENKEFEEIFMESLEDDI